MDQLCTPGNYSGSNAVYTLKMHAKGLNTDLSQGRRRNEGRYPQRNLTQATSHPVQIQGAGKLLGVYLQLYYQGSNKRCQKGKAMQFLYYMEAA